MSNEPAYRIRSHMFAKDRTYRLVSDSLCWEEVGADDQISFTDIDQIRLITFGTLGADQHRCTLRGKTGKKVMFSSHNYNSFGSFEDRSQSYADFVAELTRRVAAYNPEVKFITGSTALWLLSLGTLFIAVVGFILVAILVAAALLGKVPFAAGLFVVLLVMIMIFPGAWRAFRRGCEQSFDPTDHSFRIPGHKETPSSS